MKNTIIASFLENVEKTPNKLCLGFHKIRLTYIEVYEHMITCASLLQRKYKVSNGDFILINAISKPEYVIVYLAVQYLGAVSIPFDKMIKSATLKSLTSYIKPKLVIKDLGDFIGGRQQKKQLVYKELMDLVS
jgi:acyl-coenzyme A synthetase/AMP-(fatty) acid ligase